MTVIEICLYCGSLNNVRSEADVFARFSTSILQVVM